MLPTSSIPQISIQENSIIEGQNNQIEQLINQKIFVYPISIPQFQEYDFFQFSGKSQFLEGDKEQQFHQQENYNNSFLPNQFETTSNESLDSIDTNNLINNNEKLDSVQLVSQKADIIGNNNHIFQTSEQTILDFTFCRKQGNQEKQIGIEQILSDVADNVGLDSLQVAHQDTVIDGDGNQVEQVIDQSIITFFVTDSNQIEEIISPEKEQLPNQVIVQENLIDHSDSQLSHNQINQQINQTMIFDSIFTNVSETHLQPQASHQTDNNVNSDIDSLIETILGNSFKSTQQSIQETKQRGDNNESIQEQSQKLSFVKPEKAVFGNEPNNRLETVREMGIDDDLVSSDKINDLLKLTNPLLDNVLDLPTQIQEATESANNQLNGLFGNGNNQVDSELNKDLLIPGSHDHFIGGKEIDPLLA